MKALVWVLLLYVLLPGPGASAAQPRPAGGAFTISSGATAVVSSPAVAADGVGGFVVVWLSTSAGESRVRGQRFDPDAKRVGAELDIAGGAGGAPAVGMDADGGFLVAWPRSLGRGFEIVGRRFTSGGTAAGAPFRMGAGGRTVTVAMNEVGESAVAWGAGNGFRLQLFDGAGLPVGGVAGGEGGLPVAALAPDGQGIIASARDPGNGPNRFTDAMLGHYFDFAGNLGVTAEIGSGRWLVGGPSARVNPAGDFVMVWQERDYYEQLLIGQRFRPSHGGRQIVARRLPLYEDVQPSLALGGDDEFLVVWRYQGIAGRWYDRDFSPLGSLVRIANQGSSPRAAIAANGNVVVVWERLANRRGRGGVFGRRFLTDP